jgi:hypothetical protein
VDPHTGIPALDSTHRLSAHGDLLYDVTLS